MFQGAVMAVLAGNRYKWAASKKECVEWGLQDPVNFMNRWRTPKTLLETL